MLGAQLSTTAEMQSASEAQLEAQSAEPEVLLPFYRGLRLRLGYWPSTSFDDERARSLDWQVITHCTYRT